MFPRDVRKALLAVALTLIPWLGLTDICTRGESREAFVVRSMLTSQDWILPRAYNNAVPSKPPLFHWLAASFSLPFGEPREFALRLPSALFALGCIVFFLSALRERLSVRAQVLFILFLTFSLEWFRESISVRVDMVHASSLACGLLAGFFAIRKEGRFGMWTISTLMLAFATLGKGPVGIVLPALVLTCWIFLSEGDKGERILKVLSSLTIALVLALTWYLAAYARAPDDFFRRFWHENFERFAGTMVNPPHAYSALYLYGLFFVGTLPWSAFLVVYAAKRWRFSRATLKEHWRSSSDLVKFSIISAAVIVVFYSIPSTKRGVYLLAAYPFLAVLGAIGFEHIISKTFSRRLFAGAVALTVAWQALILPIVASRRTERHLAEDLLQLGGAQRTIFSFNHEFYGTSFYSGKTIYRAEESLEGKANAPKPFIRPGDIILTFSADLERLREQLNSKGLQISLLKEKPLGRRPVSVMEVRSLADASAAGPPPQTGSL